MILVSEVSPPCPVDRYYSDIHFSMTDKINMGTYHCSFIADV